MTGIGLIVAAKFLHIVALSVWCAGLVALPLLLGRHDPDDAQRDYARLRFLTHAAYTRILTPAAVVAITFGTLLIYLRATWVPWFAAKLVFVGVLVVLHAWIGHATLLMGEREGQDPAPPVTLMVGGALAAMAAILVLVLAKPAIGTGIVPAWLRAPLDQPLPVDEVPI